MLMLPTGNAICYSGYRHGQSPDTRIYPSEQEIREDLHLLLRNWGCLRLYDCSTHAERVLKVIARDRLDFKVMLGATLGPEMNNLGCPWGGSYSEEHLNASKLANAVELERLVALAGQYPDIVFLCAGLQLFFAVGAAPGAAEIVHLGAQIGAQHHLKR